MKRNDEFWTIVMPYLITYILVEVQRNHDYFLNVVGVTFTFYFNVFLLICLVTSFMVGLSKIMYDINHCKMAYNSSMSSAKKLLDTLVDNGLINE